MGLCETEILNKVSIIEKLSFEQRLERKEGVIWGTIDPDRGNSQCKDLKAKGCLVCSTNSKEATVAGREGRGGEWEMRSGTRKQGVQGGGVDYEDPV